MRGKAGKLVTGGTAALLLLLSLGSMAQNVPAPSGSAVADESFASYLALNRSNITSALPKTYYYDGWRWKMLLLFDESKNQWVEGEENSALAIKGPHHNKY